MTGSVSALPPLLRDSRLLRYIGASGVALGVDMGSFLLLLAAGAWPTAASAMGYGLGIGAHWLMSSRMVFTGHVAARGAGRARQKLQFVLSALAGLAVTTLMVAIGQALGIDPRLAKLCAVAASFAVTWLWRRHLIFAVPANARLH